MPGDDGRRAPELQEVKDRSGGDFGNYGLGEQIFCMFVFFCFVW